MAVSLKEEELSQSMLALDTSLNQAQSSLQAAFIKVQQLLVTKQQVRTNLLSLSVQCDLCCFFMDGFFFVHGSKCKFFLQMITEINCLRARRVEESSLGNTVF